VNNQDLLKFLDGLQVFCRNGESFVLGLEDVEGLNQTLDIDDLDFIADNICRNFNKVYYYFDEILSLLESNKILAFEL
jgi:hypothetical protein